MNGMDITCTFAEILEDMQDAPSGEIAEIFTDFCNGGSDCTPPEPPPEE